MNAKQFATLIGFATVAAWIGFGFGEAILCALGAAAGYAVAAIMQGEIDLAEVQARVQGRQTQPPPPPPPTRAPRVQ